MELAQEGLGDAVELGALCLKPLKDQIMHTDTDSLDGAGTRRVTASALAKRDASVTEELPDAVVTRFAFYKARIVAFGVEGGERLSRTDRLGFEDFVEPLFRAATCTPAVLANAPRPNNQAS